MFKSEFKIKKKYRLNHFITGSIISVDKKYNKSLLVVVLIYQFFQYFFNIRLFLLDKKTKIKKHNSLAHTLNKLLDYLYGFIFIKIIKLLNR